MQKQCVNDSATRKGLNTYGLFGVSLDIWTVQKTSVTMFMDRREQNGDVR